MTKRWISLLQSTPMRMALGLVVLFTVVSLVSLGGSYVAIKNTLNQTMRSDIRQKLAGFRTAPSTAALVARLDAEAAATDPEQRILSFVATDGSHHGNAVIAGNSPDGFRVVDFDQDDDEFEGGYLALTTTVQGGQLTIASSRWQIHDLGEMFATVLVLSLLPTALIALCGGIFIARRSAGRIALLEEALDRLTSGDLSARVAQMPGTEDDISKIGARVNTMAGAQESSVSALRQVSTDIAHDLKTPIQRVLVLLNQAREAGSLDSRTDALVKRATAETEGIVATFQSLLQIAQIEGGNPKTRFEPIDLTRLAATFVEVYAPAAEDSGHQLTLVAPTDLALLVLGDKGLLGQVLANLIENALRHTPIGSRVSVEISRSTGDVTLTVRDTGPGIPRDEREKVLRRLYRLERSRTTPGNGLGLSLVSAIADLHDATLTLEENEPGLVVELVFPRVNRPV